MALGNYNNHSIIFGISMDNKNSYFHEEKSLIFFVSFLLGETRIICTFGEKELDEVHGE